MCEFGSIAGSWLDCGSQYSIFLLSDLLWEGFVLDYILAGFPRRELVLFSRLLRVFVFPTYGPSQVTVEKS